jgi:hypothetical protein
MGGEAPWSLERIRGQGRGVSDASLGDDESANELFKNPSGCWSEARAATA